VIRIVLLTRRLLARPDGAAARTLLGAHDEGALTTALELRALPDTHLTCVAAGPLERERPHLAHALARGADRAICVSHPLLDVVDYHGVARVLAGAVRHAGFELVLVGDRSQDEAEGAVGPAVAEHLTIPHVSAARAVALDPPGHVRFDRRADAARRTLRLALPALVTVSRGLTSSPSPGKRAGDKEREARIEALDLEALGIRPPELKYRDRCLGRATRVRASRRATVLSGAAELVARLRDDHLLGD
jgi:electron transfer flavoprotein alpha/beta subunit